MKAKYIMANSIEDAEIAACEYFGCNKAELIIEIVSQADVNTTAPCAVIAIYDAPPNISNMDAFYGVYYEPDAVYLEIYGKRGTGAPVNSDDLLLYLKRKNISGINLNAVQHLLDAGEGRVKIAGFQKEHFYGEDVTVEVTSDEKEAYIKLLEGEPNGAPITVEGVKAKLAEKGVIHGIDEEAIAAWLNAKIYDQVKLVALATDPVDGEDGKLIFHFSTEERTGRPVEIDASGKVDYRTLDLYVAVTEGQLLVTKTSATEGIPGTTVRGTVLSQRPGKDAALPRGKNVTYNEERTEMRASCSGMVELVNNAINVSNLYSIKGDCDISTGNIDFDGSVHISGSVRSGSSVKATDGIMVGGSVEASSLIAGGNVEVKGGMQGADKGFIQAGGAVSVMFVERGRVSADGPITVDVSIHSNLESGSTIHALGKRGAIIGGTASAAGDIVANFIGALSNTKTSVEVGFLPIKRAHMENLEKEMQKLNANKLKLEQLDAYLEKTKNTMDKATWDKLFISGVENKKLNKEAMEATRAEIDQLRYEIEHATNNKVHVLETIYGGSRITIGANSYMVTDDIGFATFKYSNGEITYTPCEKSKTDFK